MSRCKRYELNKGTIFAKINNNGQYSHLIDLWVTQYWEEHGAMYHTNATLYFAILPLIWSLCTRAIIVQGTESVPNKAPGVARHQIDQPSEGCPHLYTDAGAQVSTAFIGRGVPLHSPPPQCVLPSGHTYTTRT